MNSPFRRHVASRARRTEGPGGGVVCAYVNVMERDGGREGGRLVTVTALRGSPHDGGRETLTVRLGWCT